MVNCAWLVFIRSSSRRLPEKCFKKIDGSTILEHICSNMNGCNIRLEDIYLCTSDRVEDRKTEKMAEKIGINVIRGDLEKPVLRYFRNKTLFNNYKFISRVNGDSPFYEPKLAIQAISFSTLNNLDPDVISNILLRKFPSGMSFEIYSKHYLDRVLSEYQELQDVEHMSDIVLHASKQKDKVFEIIPEQPIPQQYWEKLTVDTLEDLMRIREIYDNREKTKILKYYKQLEIKLEIPTKQN